MNYDFTPSEIGSMKWGLDIAIDRLITRHPDPGDIVRIAIYRMSDLRMRIDTYEDDFVRAVTKENSK